MKKYLTVLILLSIGGSAFAANWLKIKQENAGTYYLDTTSYKCGCKYLRSITFNMKQIPTYSDASVVFYKIHVDIDRDALYTHTTRYGRNGVFLKEQNLPTISLSSVNPNSALFVGMDKVADYCDRNICK